MDDAARTSAIVAIVNRTRILPALSGSGGRPPMHRLAAFVGGEAVLALVLLALADDLGEPLRLR